MKAHAVAALKADYPLAVLLDIAALARSTYFYHQAKQDQPDPLAALKDTILEIFDAHHGRYGHRRIHVLVMRQGWQVAKKTVLKLMRLLGLKCHVRRRRRYNSFQGEVGRIAENTLNREFTATAPNEKWVTDVTEFRVDDRKIYLSPIIDLFDRSVIAYSCSLSPTTAFTNSSLERAIATLEPGQHPIVHSDQGFQYQHLSWRLILESAQASQSMSRRANCLDNAVAENFFGHLKSEMFHHTRFDSVEEFIRELDAYIDWYNNVRISISLNGLSPVQYRAQALAA